MDDFVQLYQGLDVPSGSFLEHAIREEAPVLIFEAADDIYCAFDLIRVPGEEAVVLVELLIDQVFKVIKCGVICLAVVIQLPRVEVHLDIEEQVIAEIDQ